MIISFLKLKIALKTIDLVNSFKIIYIVTITSFEKVKKILKIKITFSIGGI